MREYLFSCLFLFLISGCGGGNGDGSSDGGDSAQNLTTAPIDQQAKVDSSSVENYLAAIRLPFSHTLVEHVVEFFTQGSLIYQSGDVDIILDNPCGGSVQISGSLDETASTGNLTLVFSNYQDCMYNNPYTFTGSADLSVYNTEIYASGGNIKVPSEFLLSATNLQIGFGTASITLEGTVEFNYDTTSDPEFDWPTYTSNYTLSDSTGSGSFTNFIQKDYTGKGDFYIWGLFGSSYEGGLYDSDSGYVDASTVNAVVICSSIGQNCPLDRTKEGRIKLSGDTSSALIQLGSNIDTISIDSDGDDDYEQVLRCDPDHCY
jgi:hypothetical protein